MGGLIIELQLCRLAVTHSFRMLKNSEKVKLGKQLIYGRKIKYNS